ncbi:hypothetical protein BGZ61DRAFT_527718 [Ilyonectria robusta]|uniref:uncharacterized protein n=1 Tax=Ilyonectria robusta TaxID=1079257 RepID=UPI001E8E6B46|nr:uncharacterized protein BGZ61DRAFT_527718 [Ilyonectria robusta]KAH8734363.1 hypothetical protein BGZ61DRAFT_527718 [Ilyonectria robusta]
MFGWSADSVNFFQNFDPECLAEPTVGQDSIGSQKRSRVRRQIRKIPTIELESPLPETNLRRRSILACPFYKAHPQKYQDCLKYELRRIKDVKQHIYRKHSKPEFYCARCFQEFSTAESRDEHTVEPRCIRKEEFQFDGISSSQRKSLNSYVDRTQTAQEQWYGIWKVLFSDKAQPSTCFVGSYFEEITSQLREFWGQKKTEILSSALGETNIDNMSPNLLDKVIGKLFDRFESALLSSAPTMNTMQSSATAYTTQRRIEPADGKDKKSCEESRSTETSEDGTHGSREVESLLVDNTGIQWLEEWVLDP